MRGTSRADPSDFRSRAFVEDNRPRAILVCIERAPRLVEGIEVRPWREVRRRRPGATCLLSSEASEAEVGAEVELALGTPLVVLVDPVAEQELRHELPEPTSQAKNMTTDELQHIVKDWRATRTRPQTR